MTNDTHFDATGRGVSLYKKAASGTGEPGDPYIEEVALGTGSNVIGGVEFVDENGDTYGVKQIGNKPRVSSTPYYVDIAEGNVPDHSAVNKFGHNSDVGATLEPIWDYSGPYEYLADDTFATMYISSDSAADTGMTFAVSGIDSDYNASTVTVTTDASDGRTFVALTSGATDDKWWRIFRAQNTSGTDQTGNIYISKDNTDAGGNGIPDTVADIQAQVRSGMQQTLMAQWTVPAGNTAFIVHLYGGTSIAKATEIYLFVRPFGGVFNVKHLNTVIGNAYAHDYSFPLPVTEKSDIRMVASVAGGGGEVSAGFDLWYEPND
jgi:hypothetical protein